MLISQTLVVTRCVRVVVTGLRLGFVYYGHGKANFVFVVAGLWSLIFGLDFVAGRWR
jgi:hypothetical protein